MSNLKRHQQDWEELGKLDPLWAVLSRPGKENGGWKPEEFYETGRERINAQRNRFAELKLPDRFEKILDFGCGAGRLTYAWGEFASRCVGVDISEAMLESARRGGRSANCEFLHNPHADLTIFGASEFDLVHSEIALQHIPEREVIKSYLREFIRVARPGALIYFQLPSHLPISLRYKLRRPLYHFLSGLGISNDVLYRRLNLNPMKMTAVPVDDVRAIFAEKCECIAVDNPNSVYTYYYFRKSA